jgi:hypothetical protein
MDWRREGDILEQILALLVALAGLADRAAAAPLCLVLPALAFLARAEDVARSCLVDMPAGAPAFLAASRSEGRAVRLAAEFRALARILRVLMAKARRLARFATRNTARRAAAPLRPCSPGCADACPAAEPRAPDTS